MLNREGRDIIRAKRRVLIPRAARTSLRIRPIRAKRTILKSVGGKGMWSWCSKAEIIVPEEEEKSPSISSRPPVLDHTVSLALESWDWPLSIPFNLRTKLRIFFTHIRGNIYLYLNLENNFQGPHSFRWDLKTQGKKRKCSLWKAILWVISWTWNILSMFGHLKSFVG